MKRFRDRGFGDCEPPYIKYEYCHICGAKANDGYGSGRNAICIDCYNAEQKENKGDKDE